MKKPAPKKTPAAAARKAKPISRKIAALIKGGDAIKKTPLERHREKLAAKAEAKTTAAARTIETLPAGVESTLNEIDLHPYCKLLPMMSGDELAALRDDIDANGQREPGVVLDDKILDGRNRYLACFDLGRPFAFRRFDPATEGTPLSYIISKATHRNMDDTQKACSAVGIQDELVKEGLVTRTANLRKGDETPEREPVPFRGDASRETAGALFGVSGRYVSEARLLRDNAPDLFEKCFNGQEVLTRAKREYKRRQKKDDLTKKAAAARVDVAAGDRSRIITGDALAVLPTIEDKARLAFLDPKYNLNRKYDAEGTVDDNMSPAEYGKWLAALVELSAAKLTDDGSICVMIHARWQALVFTTLDNLGLHWRDTFIWKYNFGNSRSAHTGFTPAYVPILHFSRQPARHVFNGESVLVESWRQANGDKRANEGGKVMDNVFDVPRLVDNHPEKMPGFDNQVPLAVMTPIVLALSDPGDLIIDPGVGSGTTGVVAVTHDRRFLGIEVVPDNAQMAGVRIAAARADALQKPAFAKPGRKAS